MQRSSNDASTSRRPTGSLERLATRVAMVVERIEEILLSSSVLLIAAMTIANVFCRSLLGFSLAVTDEVAQVAIIVLCFTGLSYAAGKGRHIRMTAIYDMLPPAARKGLMVVITSVTSAILFALAWYAVAYVVTVYRLGGISPALRIPFWMLYAIAPVGLFLAAVQYALAAVKNVTSPGIYLSFTHADTYETDEDEPSTEVSRGESSPPTEAAP
jgi:TRAP-type C4-dicarboxylate transport system, small permease component